MTHKIIFDLTTGVILTTSVTNAALIEVSPALSDFANLSYASNFSCAKSGTTCYYCGSTSSCPTGCGNYVQVQTGKYQTIGESAIGCLGNQFCIAPRNGILTFKDGLTTNTEYKFYGYLTEDSAHCRRRLGPTVCTNWASTAVSISNYPFCRCTTTSTTTLSQYKCDICDQGYYLAGEKCEQCPTASDIYTNASLTTTARGTTISTGATDIAACYITADTYFDNTGTFKLTDKCNW